MRASTFLPFLLYLPLAEGTPSGGASSDAGRAAIRQIWILNKDGTLNEIQAFPRRWQTSIDKGRDYIDDQNNYLQYHNIALFSVM